jgi:predicted DNA-binding ribbon-helix-helix protein
MPVRASCLVNRNVTALRGRTSMRLEPELWEALEEICLRENMTLAEAVKEIERLGHPGGRTSAVRVHVLSYFRRAASEAGHQAVGHGTRAEVSASRPQASHTQAPRAAAPPI